VDRRKLPQELAPFGERLKAMGSALGLWISPWGGYDQARKNRIALAQAQGYEHMGDFLCLAGERYFELFRRRVLDYQEKFNIGFWKIDGFLSTCNRADHGHAIGRFSRRVLLDRFLHILTDLRRQRPDVRIDITVGTWQSPWWLKWADYVWMGGGDFGFTQAVPSLTQRDQALTYRDQVMYGDLVTAGYIIPTSAFMTHGIIKGRLNMLGGEDEPPEAFLKNAVMYFSRGVAMWELYLTPERVSETEWQGLVKILQWGRRQWPLLRHTEFVGGAPQAGAVYGYAHFDGDRGWLTLRNPAPVVQKFALPLDEKLGKINILGKWQVLQQFPQQQGLPGSWRPGEIFETVLQPYETAVFEFFPESSPPDLWVIGAPYRVQQVHDGRGVLEIMPLPGKTYSVRAAAAVRLAETPPEKPAPATATHPELRAMRWTAEKGGLAAEVQLAIPGSWQQTELIVLYQPQAPRDSLRVSASGAEGSRSLRKDGDGAWWWITVPLAAGEQTVRLHLDGPFAPGDSARVFVRGKPKRRVLRVPIESGASPKILPELPVAWNRERVLVPLAKMQAVGRK